MFKSLDHFEIDEIKALVHISRSKFNFPDMSRELYTGVHWQKKL